MTSLKKNMATISLALPLLLAGNIASAGENLWLYAQGTDTRPDGSFEFKLKDTIRIDKDSGSYVFHDIRPEIEYGITDKLTVGAELMLFHHNYSGIEEGNDPVRETQEAHGGSFKKMQYGGFELAMKYNILSPYKDFMGLSVGLGYEDRDVYRLDGAEIDQRSYTVTLFMQKNFLDDKLNFVFMPKIEFERRKPAEKHPETRVLEEEIALEFAAAVSYRFRPNWNIGLEFRHQSDYLSVDEDGEFEEGIKPSSFDFGDFQLGDQFQRGNYFGPSIHYAQQRWWATASLLYQVSGGGSNSFHHGGKNWDEHEKYHVGFNFGYEF